MTKDFPAAWTERLIAVRRHLHAHPELSNEEHETTAYLREQLAEAGIRELDLGLSTGLVAEIGSAVDGPIVAVRADIDALPVQEETGLDYASRVPGRMHACGHDFHAAALLGAALRLKAREADLPGRVRLLFQPAEEKAKGAVQLIRSGALEGVQAIFGLHNKPDLRVGAIGVKSGPLMAAADGFAVDVRGRGSHAAVPEVAVDPIVVAAHIVTALQSIVSRNVGPLDSAVVSVTRLNAGTSWNVIPEHAVFDGTLRTFDPVIREHVRKRFAALVSGIAASFESEASIRWIDGPPAVVNDEAWTRHAAATAERIGLQTVVPRPSPAGEDFAFYLQQIPGAFVFVGTSGEYEWHHPKFDLDEKALPQTAEYLAALAGGALERLQAARGLARHGVESGVHQKGGELA
ncbi:amidohydrolase [Paenibacillus sp. IB182496]|uniref:Amidohydrolase n=1 Tax=Paenibacillus sabuli TaxID=2772509 RepID=A0A927GQG6_9BACL|nr:amidohydrolase [Paenibacillus sabuli]